jgi:hypothetical protein
MDGLIGDGPEKVKGPHDGRRDGGISHDIVVT